MRGEIRRKESSPQPGIELTTTSHESDTLTTEPFGRGEIAYEVNIEITAVNNTQNLPSDLQDTSQRLIFEGYLHNSSNEIELLIAQARRLTTLREKPLENNVRKGENVDDQHFLLFSQCCYPK